MDPHNKYISDEFEHAFTKFGKNEYSAITKSELINFIKFMHGFEKISSTKKVNQVVC